LTGARVEIIYCTRCKFLLRAAWLAQELLASFESDVDEVALRPGSGGIFEIRLNGEVIASNANGGAIPDAAEVKRLLRDRIAPGRRIGHDSG
jgi:selenoprotein W-related protein